MLLCGLKIMFLRALSHECFVSWLNELCWVIAIFNSSLCVMLMGLCLVQWMMYCFL